MCKTASPFFALNICELPQIEMLSEMQPLRMWNDTLLLEHFIFTSVWVTLTLINPLRCFRFWPTSTNVNMRPQKEHMLLVCGRWAGPGAAVHGDFVLRRLLGVDGLHRLFLKHRPVTCGFICQRETRQENSKIEGLGGLTLNGGCEKLPELPHLLFQTQYTEMSVSFTIHPLPPMLQ